MVLPRRAFDRAPAHHAEAISPSLHEEKPTLPETAEDLRAFVEQHARELNAQADEAIAEGERESASSEISEIQGDIDEARVLALDRFRELADSKRDPALDRLNRELRAANAIDKLERGEELEKGEAAMMRGLLESRGWYKLFTRLKSGDAVATFLVPSGDKFSIKKLNDEIFGPVRTDAIIEFRREALRSAMEELGVEELSQSFRDGFFRIPEESQTPAFLDRLKAVAEVVSARVTQFMLDMLEAEGPSDDPKRQAALDDFRYHLTHPEHSYRITFGAGDVGSAEGEGDYTHVERAVSDSFKGALRARDGGDGAFGAEDAAEAIHEISQLRGEIMAAAPANILVDVEGRVFPLFQKTEGDYTQLNLDVIRDLRKGKLEAGAGHEQAHALVKEYLRKLNLFDVLKPYTHEEAVGDTVHGTNTSLQAILASTARHAHALSEGQRLSADERGEIADDLRREGKDRACTSAVEFHQNALEIADCTYVSLDVLDVGPKLLQEFERLSQEVERGRKTFDEAALTAGDETTRLMRAFRETAMRVASEHGGGDRPLMLVGGDEATLALPSHIVTDELLLALRAETGSRVVKTVVASAERHSDLSDPEAVKREHLAARKRAESGTEAAKEVEATLRELGRIQDDLPAGSKRNFASRMADLRLDVFAVIERHDADGFDVMLRETEQGKSSRFTLDDLRGRFDELKRLAKETTG